MLPQENPKRNLPSVMMNQGTFPIPASSSRCLPRACWTPWRGRIKLTKQDQDWKCLLLNLQNMHAIRQKLHLVWRSCRWPSAFTCYKQMVWWSGWCHLCGCHFKINTNHCNQKATEWSGTIWNVQRHRTLLGSNSRQWKENFAAFYGPLNLAAKLSLPPLFLHVLSPVLGLLQPRFTIRCLWTVSFEQLDPGACGWKKPMELNIMSWVLPNFPGPTTLPDIFNRFSTRLF